MPLDLDPDLLEILACPAPDHGTLHPGTPDDPEAAALTCSACDRRYPVTDGIPVLLLSEASGGPPGETAGPDDRRG
ncbi:Trm112 family protein [Actinomycetospora sp. CA-101289]|uniref:Trm112 family protein n=1 Tax=Actinomycetospora sp. CA-101289 TaxID=3239893 RepID=UPI003D994D4F